LRDGVTSWSRIFLASEYALLAAAFPPRGGGFPPHGFEIRRVVPIALALFAVSRAALAENPAPAETMSGVHLAGPKNSVPLKIAEIRFATVK
jgi:hypothetical protein